MTDPDTRSVRLLDVAVLVVAAVLVATLVGISAGAAFLPEFWGPIVVAALAAELGVPALMWAFSRGRTGARVAATLGALAGALPPAGMAAAGVLSYRLQYGQARLARALGSGLPLPLVDRLPWAAFARIEARAVLIGVVTGLIYERVWLRSPRTWPDIAIAAGITAAAALLAWLIGA